MQRKLVFKMPDLKKQKRNFFNTAIADIYRSIDAKSVVAPFILSFCLIDYLTWIEFGDLKFGFNEWIKSRLLPLNIFYQGKDEELYSVRNGLVHTYGPSKNIIKQKFQGYELKNCDPGLHLQKVNNKILKICLYSLITEIVYAAHLMFEELEQSGTDEQIDRLNKQIKILGSNPPEFYRDMHAALSVFDAAVITMNHIRGDYTAKILYPER